jgi:hypothetical protein
MNGRWYLEQILRREENEGIPPVQVKRHRCEVRETSSGANAYAKRLL